MELGDDDHAQRLVRRLDQLLASLGRPLDGDPVGNDGLHLYSPVIHEPQKLLDVPPGRPEVGLLNALVKSIGFEAQPWLTMDQGRLNSFLLMAVVVWLQVGYSMVVISAAIKNVPEETLEAAQLDGASAWQVFAGVVLPQVWGTVMSVFVTVLILVMKIFDIVLGMTRGNFTTSVLAFEWYKQFFENSNIGPASAVVTVLVLLIGPLMYLQIKTVQQQEALR